MRYPHLWGRLYGAPLAIHPEKAAVIEAVFRARLNDAQLPDPKDDSALFKPHVNSASVKFREGTGKPYGITSTGIAVIPVLGTLVHRASGLDAMSGLMSYGLIQRRLNAAIDDPEVRGVILEIDSYGGEAYGLQELADGIDDARKKKPVWAAVNEEAFSAAYFIAAAADRIYIPVSGLTGSIGTIALHVDQSKRDAKEGYVYTYVYAGAHKKDFNPHEQLSDQAREALQAEVDRHYGLFVEHVATSRGLDEDAVRGTEAGLLAPDVAVDAGFADGVATFSETIGLMEEALKSNSFSSTGTRLAVRRPSTHEKENHMSDPKDKAASQPGAADQPKHTDAQLNAAVEAARTSAKAEGVKEGATTGTKAERDRVRGILTHAEAKERGGLAMSLALESDMTVEQAVKAISAAPKQTNTGFAAAMAQLKNPAVGADGGGNQGGAEVRINTGAIYATRRQQSEAHKH